MSRLQAAAIVLPLLLALHGCAGEPVAPPSSPPEFYPPDGAILTADFDVVVNRSDADSVALALDGTPLAVLHQAPFAMRFDLLEHPVGEHTLSAHVHTATGVDTLGSEVLLCRGVGLRVGNYAPSYSLPDRDGTVHAMNDTDRARLVMLQFWATWCPACRSSLPATQRLCDELTVRGLRVLTVTREPEETVGPFMAARGYTYPVLLDARGLGNAVYSVVAIPTYYLIDRRGVIRYTWVGSGNGVAMERKIRQLLAE